MPLKGTKAKTAITDLANAFTELFGGSAVHERIDLTDGVVIGTIELIQRPNRSPSSVNVVCPEPVFLLQSCSTIRLK